MMESEAAFDKRLRDLAEELLPEAVWEVLIDDPQVAEGELYARAREVAMKRARERLARENAHGTLP